MSQQLLIPNFEKSTQAYPFVLSKTKSYEYGAQLDHKGCNFGVYAPDASEVFICIYNSEEQLLCQIQLAQRRQSSWYGYIRYVGPEHLYGIRIKPKAKRQTHPHSSIDKLLIDPYAKALNRPLLWDKALYHGDSHKMIPKAKILKAENGGFTPLAIPAEARIIYEAHVKGISAQHPDVPDNIKGSYLGACHPSIIKHLQKLGVTSVQFMPLMAFMSEPFISDKGLCNYWGYNPVNLFAPEPRYATHDALAECKQMIQSYRDANIEVILDVVFNHTCESGADGPIFNFRALCESHAYLLEQIDESDMHDYLNYSGCGNTLRVSDSYILNLVLDALRYWVSEMGVSGFRFDLASIVGREALEFTKNASFFKILKQDPVLKNVMMLAEPWDIGPGGYQLGHYPASWLEVNDKYRDTVRGFWRGDKGLKGEFATRLMGSRDVFRKNVRPLHASVNNVTYHDGFTLHDLVSYSNKHNDANLEDNRDGHNHNLSANYGVEGETQDESILELREQQKRNMFATLLLSQGTPHILGGDELSKTQQGNNNAYCQDNPINWYHWELNERQNRFLAFCCYLVNLRKQHPLLQQMNFSDDNYDNKQNIISANWYRTDGSHKSDIDWVNHEHHCFALHVVGLIEHENGPQKQQWLLCINNLDTDTEFTLGILAEGEWTCLLDTSKKEVLEYQEANNSEVFSLKARSLRLYKK